MMQKRLTSFPAAAAAALCISTFSLPVQARALPLPALPAGCTYADSLMQPLQDVIKFSAATPLYAAVGDAPKTVASIDVQCDGTQSGDVSIGLAPSPSVQWVGPGQDIMATDVPGIGIRLITESESDGGVCRQQGVLSAGQAGLCSMGRAGGDARRLKFTVRAQAVKTGNDTPLQMRRTLQAASGGSLLLTVNGKGKQVTDLFSLGLFSPAVITEASCTLVTEQTQTVSFGQVYRPKSSAREHTLGPVRATPIEVACYPKRAAGANDYSVSVIFSAGELYRSRQDALATSVDDLAIRFSAKPEGENWLKFGDSQPMAYAAENADRSHFSQVWYWFLRYMPEGDHLQTGELNAVATYTITIL